MREETERVLLDARKRVELVELAEGIAEMVAQGLSPHVRTKELPSCGKALSPGKDGCVSREERAHLERIIGSENLLPVGFLEEGVIRARAVARVALTVAHAGLPSGSGWGTGSLISQTLFLTNNHVIPSSEFARNVEAQFNYQNDHTGTALTPDVYSFDPTSFFHTNADLDYTVIRVSSREYSLQIGGRVSGPGLREPVKSTASAARLDSYLPIDIDTLRDYLLTGSTRIVTPGRIWGFLRLGPTAYAPDDHLNIVQHPRGRRKEVALQQNRLTEIFTDFVHYTTDTEPGSSGSPVFDNQWDLMALHHAAGDFDSSSHTWIDNEGIRIDRIINDLNASLSGTPAGDAILDELGIA
jgi:endonuclease G